MKKLVIRPSKTIRQKVYEYLREQILNGEIDAGNRLVEAELADRTGTSRTPVREALHTLEREGLVESLPRVGYVVRSISETEVKELCGIRLALEDLPLLDSTQKYSVTGRDYLSYYPPLLFLCMSIRKTSFGLSEVLLFLPFLMSGR